MVAHGTGNDIIDGGTGDDTAWKNDEICGADGIDIVVGGGNDFIKGGAGRDNLGGGRVKDLMDTTCLQKFQEVCWNLFVTIHGIFFQKVLPISTFGQKFNVIAFGIFIEFVSIQICFRVEEYCSRTTVAATQNTKKPK